MRDTRSQVRSPCCHFEVFPNKMKAQKGPAGNRLRLACLMQLCPVLFLFFQRRSSLSISTLVEYRCGLIHLHSTAGYEHNKSSHVGPTTGVAANPIMMIGPGLEGTWWWLLMEMSILALLPKPRSDKARAAKIGSEVRKCLHPCSDRECVLRYCVGKPSRKSEQNKTTPKPNTDVIVWETCSYINDEVLRHGPPC